MMRTFLASLVLLFVCSGASIPRNITAFPAGFEDVREDLTDLHYLSQLSEPLQPLQAKILEIENRAHGIAASNADYDVKAQQLLALEIELYQALLTISNIPAQRIEVFERDSLFAQADRAMDLVRTQSEGLYENMLRFIDKALPGSGGLQVREVDASGNVLYIPNYRSDTPLSTEQRGRMYVERMQDFLNNGGDISEIENLSRSFMNERGAFIRVEYVMRADGSISVSEGRAGHVILAAGQPVMAAGQMIFIRDGRGRIQYLMISNSSGNYKPDLSSAWLTANAVVRMFRVPRERIQITKGEPLSVQALKVFLKGQGVSQEEIRTRIDPWEELIRNLGVTESLRSCSRSFKTNEGE